jgi:hypothetical protein
MADDGKSPAPFNFFFSTHFLLFEGAKVRIFNESEN